MSHRTKCLLLSVLLVPGLQTFAQTSTVSNPLNGRENNPYSKYGIGELDNGNNVVLRGMGNVTSAYASPYSVNSDNPASYASLRRTTFEAGAVGSTRTISNGTDKFTSGTASISYLNIGIPVGKNAGLCLGFRPYSRAYYNLADTITSSSNPPSPIGMAVRSYNGESSLTLPYIGFAYKYKGLSVGANLGYLFGTVRSTSAVIPKDSLAINNAYISEFTNFTRIGGIYWKGGLMYEHNIDSAYTLRIGGTVTLNQKLTERFYEYQIASYYFSDTTVHDTVSNTAEQRGKLTMPFSYSAGIMFGRTDKWNIGIDYQATQWSQYNSSPDLALNAGVGASSYKLSIGGEITPDINSIRNYTARMSYRLGLYYGKDYLNINNTDLPFYGITAGVSLPFRRSLSRLHTSLDVGRLGTTANGLTQQTYVRFSVGISFNDLWFVKRRYD
jgi:hypothetical protein